MPYTGLKHLGQKERKPLQRKEYSYEEFNMFRQAEGFSLSDRETEFFWRMHCTLQEASRNLGVGPRVVKQIEVYLRNLPENPYLSKKEALDFQVVQRIMTKLRGPEGLLKGLIGRVDTNDNVEGSSLMELLNEFNDLSDFEETRKTLIHKAKELKINGYTI
jgi:hypothetical protein